MEKTNKQSEKIFLGLGIITIISGVFLAFENPTIGIPGSIVGAWITFDNFKKIKEK